ncbi:MAG: TlpA family protein disulfide reductase [Odoribacteraceae bacterium]|jgi:peroxiredoxin|nr:TlpA family protein disulfide reductase [Odoribacteraceae bacterium]
MKETTTFIFSLLMACLFSCVRSDGEDLYEASSYIKVGDEIPDFTLSNEAGALSKSDLAGKKTLLVLFATTCGDCQRVLPVIEAAWNVLKSDPAVAVVLISREETAGAVSSYWAEAQLTMPYYLDTDRAVFNTFAKAYTPRVYLINPLQRVVEMHVESLKISAGELCRRVQAL